ncbi:hypothetical protein [Sphingopyxis indica]|uniref:hypothetical protein n=1 Tax=Sphingopyxis indica TaxID=436663 RepID=UPI0029391756|nr:hypothetical protein [Sphingopyxis indica]
MSDDAAAEVVKAVEEYVAVKIKDANAEIRAQLKAQTWLIGAFGLIIAAGVVMSGAAQLFN